MKLLLSLSFGFLLVFTALAFVLAVMSDLVELGWDHVSSATTQRTKVS